MNTIDAHAKDMNFTGSPEELTLTRETVRNLSHHELAGVAGGGDGGDGAVVVILAAAAAAVVIEVAKAALTPVYHAGHADGVALAH
jgi:hypothetical protein